MSVVSRLTPHASRRTAGVALVITLIMISVITFMAITFLAVSRREKGQTTTVTDQLTAREAANAAQDRALAQFIATILANTNANLSSLLVSTNFVNWNGYISGINDPTNVNYEGAAALNSPLEQLRNLANLRYDPRPPVFVTNKFYGSNEFRFYIDLNRDGRYTPNGRLAVTNENGGFYDTKGNPIPASGTPPANTLSNYFTGDPEYIGIVRRADFNHGPNNEFLSRYAFIVMPAGLTLDVNYIHNYARNYNSQLRLSGGVGDGFRRNQGISGGENNMASFFVDLNTNAWPGPRQASTTLGSLYQYSPDAGANTGSAFDDALGFLRYRYATNSQNLWPAYGLAGSAFDRIDAYARSPIMSNVFGLTLDLDATLASTASPTPWHESDNPNHFWTGQDFFDQGKLPAGFITRLNAVQTNSLSSYDRYTYYRMLSQLGTDSVPETDTDTGQKAPWQAGLGKLNLNYVNVGGFKATTTNLVSWRDPLVSSAFNGRSGAEVFFLNAADRLVRRYSEEWRDLNYRSWTNLYTYTNTFGTNQPFGASQIPVFINGRFVYSPSLHRQLQLAANLWDSVNGASDARGPLPTVFRPIFATDKLGNVYISDFKEVNSFGELQNLTLRDLSDTNIATKVKADDLVFGVPLIIGARKGLPNFNEFSAETVVSVTRKVELRKRAEGGANMINETNQMFVIGISNVFGAEFWNSYTKIYPRAVDVFVTNYCQLSLTNDYGFNHRSNLVAGGAVSFNANTWAAWDPKRTAPPATGPWSFVVPMRSNHIILSDSIYRQSANRFDPITTTVAFERNSGTAFPRWGLAITNRVMAVIRERDTDRVIDFVQLNGMITYREISLDIADPPPGNAGVGGFKHLWATNAPDTGRPSFLGDAPGVYQQILVSGGKDWGFEPGQNWQNNGVNQPSGATRDQAIANFHAFFENNHTYLYTGDAGLYAGTNSSLIAVVPFSPTKKYSVPMIWQANDPLVHYTSGDMQDLEKSGVMNLWTPPSATSNTVANLRQLNTRYRPWGNYPNSPEDDTLTFSTVVKDPGVTRSDDWQFPTNMLPTLGWMGRIHRGTPWQTVYLKSSRVADSGTMFAAWTNWTGNGRVWRDNLGRYPVIDPVLSQPEEDRNILELFTVSLNDNAVRGQLPINQSGLAAWSAVFGGMVALTNTIPDADLAPPASALTGYGPQFIEPAGAYDLANTNTRTWPAVRQIVEGINRTRANTGLFPSGTFTHLGDVLATPELTEASPFLRLTDAQRRDGVNDAAYEWLPQQMLSLVRLGEPRFVIYSFGQALKPARNGVQLSGSYQGMITNYQITAEVATRAVVRVVGSPDPETAIPGNHKYELDVDKRYPPRIVVESFNVLPPD